MNSPQLAHARESFCQVVRATWWIVLLRGILLLLIGAFALFSPGLTLVAFAQVIGFYLVVEGALAIYAGATKQAPNPFWTIVRGLVLVLVGLIGVAYPALFAAFNATLFVSLLAFGCVFSGVAEIYFAIKERHQIEGEGWLIVGGLLAIFFGAILLARPILASLVFAQVLGAFAIVGGISLIFTAFRFRRFGQKLADRVQAKP